MTRTVWSHAERDAVFDEMRKVFLRTPTISRITAMQEAQQVLPMHRRVVVNHQRVFSYRERIEQAQMRALRESKSAAQPPVEPPVETPAPAAPAPVQSSDEAIVRILAQLVDAVIESVAQRVARAVLLQMAEPVDPAAPARPRHDPRPPSDERVARPGVLVIGLLPSQAHTIETLYSQRLDLRFLTADEAQSHERVQRAHTVLMTKFISHSVQEKYRKAPALHLCNGGVTDLAKILDRL